MNTLELLGIALGLATLAGINLYLTVLVAGLCVNFQWVILPPDLAQLNVLGNPWIIGAAGILYLLQFFADKIPWVDSLNDSVHTVIRPLGGVALGVLALGDSNPVVLVIAGLMAGGAALTAHTAKAGVRLLANASPEPVSNIGLSLGEDATVLGGLFLLMFHPVVAGIVALVLLMLAWILLPKILRATRATVWLAWRKLNAPARVPDAATQRLPVGIELALRRAHAEASSIRRAAFCVSGGGLRLPKNHLGWLILLDGAPPRAFFVAVRLRGPLIVEIPLQDAAVLRTTKFLSEALGIKRKEGRHTFHFERSQRDLADAFAADLEAVTTTTPPPAPDEDKAAPEPAHDAP